MKNTTLTHLEFSLNEIGDTVSSALVEALKENKALTSLDLTVHHIGDDGAMALAEALRSNTTLTHLDLKDNEEIGANGIIALAAALKNNTTIMLETDYDDFDLGDYDVEVKKASEELQAIKARNAYLQGPRAHPIFSTGAAKQAYVQAFVDLLQHQSQHSENTPSTCRLAAMLLEADSVSIEIREAFLQQPRDCRNTAIGLALEAIKARDAYLQGRGPHPTLSNRLFKEAYVQSFVGVLQHQSQHSENTPSTYRLAAMLLEEDPVSREIRDAFLQQPRNRTNTVLDRAVATSFNRDAMKEQASRLRREMLSRSLGNAATSQGRAMETDSASAAPQEATALHGKRTASTWVEKVGEEKRARSQSPPL